MYEIYERKAIRVTFPAISLTPAGKLDFNAAAARKFRENAIEHVLLLWDKDKRKIAIRSIAKRDARSFKVTYSKNHGASISAASFFKFIEWSQTKRITLPATWNADKCMFELSLSAGNKEKTSKARFVPPR